MARIRFDFGTLVLDAELLDTPTAAAVAVALPITSSVLTWGEEVYFEVPVDVAREKDARAVVVPGEVAYGRTATASPSASAARRFRRVTRRGSPARATSLPRRSRT
jgi:hypothetical protein